MAMRSVNAEPLPALETLERQGRPELAVRRSALGSWARGALALDVVLLLAAAVMSQLGSSGAGVVDMPAVWLLVYAALAVVFLRMRGMYSWQLRLSMPDSARNVVVATVLASMAVVSLRILLPGEVSDLAPQSLRLLAFSAVYLTAGRIALDWAHIRARREREAARPTLVVGAGRVGALTARRLLEHPEFGLQPIGFVDKEPLDEASLPLPVLGASWDLERLIEQHGIRHVVITFSTAPNEVLLREVERCEELGVSVSLVPRLFERMTQRLTVEHIGGLPLLSAHRVDPKGLQFALKYVADRIVAAFLLLLCLPVLAATALAVRLSVGSPIFFRQRRVGRDGREFEMLKFRSMLAATELVVVPDLPHDTAPGGVEGVDRRTPFGSFLRRTSLDELPQLLNVLKGDMSLIGPRPERPEFARQFEDNVYRYGDRHRVKSGITGWAQVHGLRGKTSLSDRVEWDNFYIENWSLWLDVKILLMTVLAVRRYFVASDS
jgi:exopolysaccharide biosynthesis polyprenyl glycosylphosphotransferase